MYGWIARSTGNPGQSSARGTALANGHRHAGELCASAIDPRRREFLYSHQLLRVLVVWIWLDLTVMVLNCDSCAKVEFSSSVYVGWIDALYLLDNSFHGTETEDMIYQKHDTPLMHLHMTDVLYMIEAADQRQHPQVHKV